MDASPGSVSIRGEWFKTHFDPFLRISIVAKLSNSRASPWEARLANVTISKRSDGCSSQQISSSPMETDHPMGKFDQWQKICLAILDNGFVVSCPNVTKWTEWMEESFADGSHWIATDGIQGFRVETVSKHFHLVQYALTEPLTSMTSCSTEATSVSARKNRPKGSVTGLGIHRSR